MSSLPRISEAEWEVMQIIWNHPAIGAGEIVEQLAPQTDWSHRTIRTMLNRLVSKRALTFREKGNRYLYTARVKRNSYVKAQSRSLVQKLFSGDAASMLVHFVENESLSDDDLARLREVLDKQAKSREQS